MSTPKFLDAARNMSGAGFKFSNASAETMASNLKLGRGSSRPNSKWRKDKHNAIVNLQIYLKSDRIVKIKFKLPERYLLQTTIQCFQFEMKRRFGKAIDVLVFKQLLRTQK